MIVSIIDHKLAWYEYLSQELQDEIIKDVVKQGKRLPSYQRQAYELDDNSPISQLLAAIDYMVDIGGLPAILWINKLRYKEIKENLRNFKPYKLEKTPKQDYIEKYLIKVEGGGNLVEIKNNPKIEVLFTSPSYLTAKEYALSYLKNIGASKRVHITECHEWNTNVVWVMKR